MAKQPERTLIVVNHPNPDSLVRAALERVTRGIERSGLEMRVIDLDAEHFDPRLTLHEKQHHLDDPVTKPGHEAHIDALQWATRLVLIYPTWYGGPPARLKGWLDRVWMTDVAYRLPEGATRIVANLRNIRSIEIVTTHGSGRLVNLVQGEPGRLMLLRTIRLLCHPLCRRRWRAIYGVDSADPADLTNWLDELEEIYADSSA